MKCFSSTTVFFSYPGHSLIMVNFPLLHFWRWDRGKQSSKNLTQVWFLILQKQEKKKVKVWRLWPSFWTKKYLGLSAMSFQPLLHSPHRHSHTHDHISQTYIHIAHSHILSQFSNTNTTHSNTMMYITCTPIHAHPKQTPSSIHSHTCITYLTHNITHTHTMHTMESVLYMDQRHLFTAGSHKEPSNVEWQN